MGPGQCCHHRRVREGSRCESSHTACGVGEKLVELFGCRPVFANPAVGCAPRRGEVSPVEASARYLKHIGGALERANCDYSEVILTVPASFDAAARELTIEAAEVAGLK